MIIDAWAQHSTLRHLQDPIFESLRRWTGDVTPSTEQPVEVTIAKMNEAGVSRALISAWVAPGKVMISNDEVAGFVEQYPDRLVGIGSVDISKPVQAVTEVRRCVNELVSCPVNSHDFRAFRNRRSKARSAGNTGCIAKGRNAAATVSEGKRSF